jgi:hypothetical protein
MLHKTKIQTILALVLGWGVLGGGSVFAAEQASWADVKGAFVVEGEDGVTYMAFSQEALRRAGKRPVKTASVTTTDAISTADASSAESTSVNVDLLAEESRSVSQWVRPKGAAQLYLQDNNSSSTIYDNLQVNFVVPSGAVNERVLITMTVYGNYLSDLVVAFQPGGLVFNMPAELQVGMGGDLINIDTADLVVLHEYADGTVEETTINSTKTYQGNMWFEFDAMVPGFSRYGIRRGF